jgi:hypothetical protein
MFELVKTAVYVSALQAIAIIILGAATERGVRKTFVRPLLPASIVLVFAVFCSPSIWIAHAAAFLFVPILARKRELIAPFYLTGLVTLPSLGQPLSLGGTYLFTPTLHYALGLGALAMTLAHRQPRVERGPATLLPFLAILLLLALAYSRGTSATNLVRVFLDLAFQYGLPFLLVVRSVRTPADFRFALAGLAAATVTLSVLACYEAFRSWPLYYIAWLHYDVDWGAAVKVRGGLMRAAGPYPEPTSFAFNLCIGILAIHAGRTLWTSSVARLALYGLSGAAIVATQSRGAWIGLIVGLLTYYVAIGKTKRAGQAVLGMALIGATLVGLSAVSPTIANFTGMTAEGQGTIDYRQQLFNRGVEEIRERPLFGASRDDVVHQMHDMMQGEGIVDFVNSYLFVALISGLVGLSILVAAIAAQAAIAWLTRRRWQRWPAHRPASGFGAAGLAAVISMLSVTSLVGSTAAMLSVTFGLITAWSGLRQPPSRRDADGAQKLEADVPAPQHAT